MRFGGRGAFQPQPTLRPLCQVLTTQSGCGTMGAYHILNREVIDMRQKRKPGGRTPLQISVKEPVPIFEAKIERIAVARGLTVRGHPNRSEIIRMLVDAEIARLDVKDAASAG